MNAAPKDVVEENNASTDSSQPRQRAVLGASSHLLVTSDNASGSVVIVCVVKDPAQISPVGAKAADGYNNDYAVVSVTEDTAWSYFTGTATVDGKFFCE